jgi:hypothetical protein
MALISRPTMMENTVQPLYILVIKSVNSLPWESVTNIRRIFSLFFRLYSWVTDYYGCTAEIIPHQLHERSRVLPGDCEVMYATRCTTRHLKVASRACRALACKHTCSTRVPVHTTTHACRTHHCSPLKTMSARPTGNRQSIEKFNPNIFYKK